MPIPDFPSLMLPMLRISAEGEIKTRDAVERLSDEFELTAEERAELLPSGQVWIYNRVAWAISHLKKSGLLKSGRRGHYAITGEGRRVLATAPELMDRSFLSQFESYKKPWGRTKSREATETATDDSTVTARFPFDRRKATDSETPSIVFSLNRSQLEFCQSTEQNIRLLAPAGCGKTNSLLHRCLELVRRDDRKPRFLILTFTKSAEAELKDRLMHDAHFELVRDQATITTLNAYGWRRIRNQTSNPKLLTTRKDYYFTMLNQLRPMWRDNIHIEPVVKKASRPLMQVMDNMKSMGFVHTQDTNRDHYLKRLDALERQGLSWRINEQFDLLTNIGILDRPKKGDTEGPSTSRRDFYDRFFKFWRKATEHLLEQSTFTFEDQKYWTYLDLKSPGPDGKPKPHIYGAARYNHILVDEFQDINPLDLELIKVLAERNQATVSIVGDDDQAIFEWRGATPEYILHPERYLGVHFKDYQLEINYRSPQNIVKHSQALIFNNKNRVAKTVSAAEDASTAEIAIINTDSISERLKLVTHIAKNTEYPGKVAVIGRNRSQLIPYEIYFASDGAPFKTATDLDVFGSKALDDLIKLLEIWNHSKYTRRPAQTVSDTIEICNLIKRRPLSKKDNDNLRRHLRNARSQSTAEAVATLKDYDGQKLSGKTHNQLYDTASELIKENQLFNAIKVIAKKFDGLQFDTEKAEYDVFYTDPPLEQLAEIAESEDLDVDELIGRIETAKERIKDYQVFEDDSDGSELGELLERPLHLMTAHRAKGKEFDTVILLDTVRDIWPHRRTNDQRQMEAERRLFYVAFTRARKKVIMLASKDTGSISPFVDELELPPTGE